MTEISFLPAFPPPPSLTKPTAYREPKKAWEAAQKFETMYASQFIQQLFHGNTNGLFGGGKTETLFRSVFAQSIAESTPFHLGIAESVYPALLKNQEENS